VLIKTDAKIILANALRNLLKEKTIENITIDNILEKCGASRSTFYRHFQDKYNLMNWVYMAEVDEIIKKNPNPFQFKNILIESARFIKKNEDYFSQIIKYQGQNSFMEFISTYVKNATIQILSKAIGKGKLPYEMLFSVNFYCGGVIFVISEWLKTGLKESPDKIAELIYDCIPQPIKIYL
jgi:Transcriptional regulator